MINELCISNCKLTGQYRSNASSHAFEGGYMIASI